MNLLVQGSVKLDDHLLTSNQAFTGGLITVAEAESRASVEYNNGDRVVVEHGKVLFDFFNEDDFLSALQPQEKVAKNTNLRKISLTDGSLTLETSHRDQMSKVVYTIQAGHYTLTFKEAELNVEKSNSTIKVKVFRGSVTYTSPKTPTAVSIPEGETLLLDAKN